MPYQDGTGPQGQGSRTGRGMGNCAGQGGTGRGRGRGFGRRVNATQGTSWLETQLANLQTAIEKLSEKIGQDK